MFRILALLLLVLGRCSLGFAQDSVDLDGDGRDDVRLVREEGRRFYPGGRTGNAYSGLLVTSGGGVDFLPSNFGPDSPLDFAALPPPSTGTNRFTFEYTEQLSFSPWSNAFGFNGPRYLGFRIVANGTTRYGWLLMVLDESIPMFEANYGFHRIARHSLEPAGVTVVRTPVPKIRIRPGSAGKIRCEWDTVFLGTILEAAPTINSAQWTVVAESAAGSAEFAVGSGARFFRVR